MAEPKTTRPRSALRAFLDSEASGGLVLMGAAAAALVIANSPLAPVYFGALKTYVGPLSVGHWINDALMAVFFLLVGLEIKREVVDGRLSTWSRRVLPGLAAVGGMAVPAAIYVTLNAGNPEAIAGWAIPSATDIAFALGVLSLLGNRVPVSLKVFLTALAILDDLGAVIIIALFYTANISTTDLGIAGAIAVALFAMKAMGVRRTMWPYLLLGLLLWVFVLRSGVHATIAGVLLALAIPLRPTPGAPDAEDSMLHRLEHALHKPVAFLIVPVFGFANAGVSLAGFGAGLLLDPVTLGVMAGLSVGKLVGVFGAAALAIRFGLADLPMGASWPQLVGVSLLCGIGFTMSLFIGLLAFPDSQALQDKAKIGILFGSLIAGVAGWLVLRFAPREIPAPDDPARLATRKAG
ncbi:Na+/H+ antiporter NhaA [Falsiroseomonas oryzae]|uniref:Na+/H+ antiporter NhaA n=1 Tax=Falsiroseomonas oryzae TaxID=2766473 RepID=UPI0022EAA6BA|nr:Na+/H+ antiporter NhaA [Roseomonas sp. MO-31]